MSEEPKVLDCPFCGGQATAYEYSGRHGVRCDGECPRIGYLQIPRVTGCSTQNEAIAIWNTRGHSAPSCRAAENDSLRAENARLGEALGKSRTNIECLLYMSGSQAARIEFGKASIAVIDAALEARP